MENSKERAPVQAGLFNWPEEPHGLIVSKCSTCGELVFPTQDYCPECCTETMETTTLTSKGKLKSFTEITAPPPGFKGTVPYTVGIVEFPEGIRIIGLTTENTVDSLVPNMEVEVIINTAFADDEKEYVTYKYKPSK
ncbi:Zn-ribbon domain-containing OB-fold protein [Peribacillus asahii]|uniref:Zn-ribbon domain-containing OB-fold protein n=1 Tax=Peribacillus asahii TaxID=228899 RepID=UPI00207A4EAB|nr:OB-fold domain-containing protein [Peribacillus asahii]USK68706.1 OB-fold domain-containing protein [Peribacillus asahii]